MPVPTTNLDASILITVCFGNTRRSYNGITPASQAGDAGSTPVRRYPLSHFTAFQMTELDLFSEVAGIDEHVPTVDGWGRIIAE